MDAKYHRHIIGKGGSNINKIKSESDVTINIPDTDSGVTIVRIEGNKAGVDKARLELQGMVDNLAALNVIFAPALDHAFFDSK